jgi:hypothetical protein
VRVFGRCQTRRPMWPGAKPTHDRHALFASTKPEEAARGSAFDGTRKRLSHKAFRTTARTGRSVSVIASTGHSRAARMPTSRASTRTASHKVRIFGMSATVRAAPMHWLTARLTQTMKDAAAGQEELGRKKSTRLCARHTLANSPAQLMRRSKTSRDSYPQARPARGHDHSRFRPSSDCDTSAAARPCAARAPWS